MDDEEVAAFLEARPARTAKLATVRADGRPHIAPIWYALDRSTAGPDAPIGDVVFNTAADTVKGRNLARDPRLALCVDDDTPPFTFVLVEGTATLDEDPVSLRHWATVIGGRYMGDDRAEAGLNDAAGSQKLLLLLLGKSRGQLVVRLRPTRITASARVAD